MMVGSNAAPAATPAGGLRRGGRWRRGWIRAAPYLVPSVLLLAITLPHLGQGSFRTDTGRYAAVGLQMWRTGEFWTPHLQPDTPYFNKPPLPFWVHGAVLEWLGVGVWQARLPTVAAALGCVLAMVAAARRFSGRGAAMTVGIVLATTLEFFRRTKEISLDMWQAMFLLGAVWLVASGATARRGAGWWFAGAGVAIGLGLLCKPLMALAALPVLGGWMLVSGLHRRAGWLLVALGVAAVVALPWHLSMVALHGEAFTRRYFSDEMGTRLAGAVNAKAWWYYLYEIGRYHWPWIVPTVLGLAAWVRRPRTGFDRSDPAGIRLAVLWSVWWVVLLSAFPDKRPRYGLVFYPTLAWIAGLWWQRYQPARGRRVLTRVLPVGVVVVALGGVVFALLPVRINAPMEPGFVEAAGWIRAHPGRPLLAGKGLDPNENGAFYLLTGRWAMEVGGPTHPEAPEGGVWVEVDYNVLNGGERARLPAGRWVVLEEGVVRLSEGG